MTTSKKKLLKVPQEKLLKVMKNKVKNINERYPGYRDDIAEALYGTFRDEWNSSHKSSQQFSRRIIALGDRLKDKLRDTFEDELK